MSDWFLIGRYFHKNVDLCCQDIVEAFALCFLGSVFMARSLHQLASLDDLFGSPDLQTHANIFYFMRLQY